MAKRSFCILLASALVLLMIPMFFGVAAANNQVGWVRQNSGVTTVRLEGVSAVDTNTAWAVGSNDTLLKTTDGSTWQPQTPGTTNADFTAVHAVDANTAWTVGEGGTILKTTNGTDWNAQNSGVSSHLKGVYALDANTAWAVGYDGTVLKTSDGGATWDQQVSGTTHNLYGISAVDSSTAWVVGDEGTILKTSNGTDWTPQTSGTTQMLRGACALDGSTAWAVGFSGVILKTTDSGASWDPQTSLVEDQLWGVDAVNGNIVWTVGFFTDEATLLKTRNGGSSWVNQAADAEDLYSVSAVNEDVAWAVGLGGVILKTTNGGESVTTWYLAEGSTDWGYDCYISIENPNDTPVSCTVTYMKEDGPQVRDPDVVIPAEAQATFYPRDDLGSADFSTKVECNEGKNIAVDRTMTWTGTGASVADSHCSIGVTSPSPIWYLPEGSSAWGFECWLLIQNPNTAEATCNVTYMIEGEGPQTFEKRVPANTRRTYNMADDIGAKDASIKVEADMPVIPERAMYYPDRANNPTYNRRGGHDSIGTTAPANDFYLAEGSSNWGFTTYVLIQNPNNVANEVYVTYMTTDRGAVNHPETPFIMEANSRKTIRVNDHLAGSDFSTHVRGLEPLIAERAMYWDNGTGRAAQDSIGLAEPHVTFYLPDGEVRPGGVVETFTLVQNPNYDTIGIEVSYLTPDGSGNVTFTDTIAGFSRKTYTMADRIPDGRAAVRVTCTSTERKIMVERSMYWNNRGGGTDTIGGFEDR